MMTTIMKRFLILLSLNFTAVFAYGKSEEKDPKAEDKPLSALERIEKQGFINCGVGKGIPGFSKRNKAGDWQGFDIDWCRAFAAAILGNPKRVKFIPVTTVDRFEKLKNNQIDILMRSTSWTFSRDLDQDVDYPVILYYDAQGILTHKSLDVSSIKQLNNARICVSEKATGLNNLQDYARENQLHFELVILKSALEAQKAYQQDKCDAYSDDLSALAIARSGLKKSYQHLILSDAISKEWFGPVIQGKATELADIIRWTAYALINAEEMGITRENIEELRDYGSQKMKRILGSDIGFSDGFSKPDFAYHALKAVGNYGEIFERNLGLKSDYKIERGLNKLWSDRGLIYAPPIR